MVENVWRFVLPLVFIFFMLFMPLFFVRPKEAYFAHPWVPWCFWNTLVDFFTYSYCSTYNRDFKNVLIPLCITLYHHFNLLSFYNIWIIKFNFHMVWGENHDSMVKVFLDPYFKLKRLETCDKLQEIYWCSFAWTRWMNVQPSSGIIVYQVSP